MSDTYKQTAARYVGLIETRLNELLPPHDVKLPDGDAIPALLNEAMRYSLLAGGKRLRPMLLLSTVELLGGDVSDALTTACALEMIHTYSLIHDDLPGMDDDSLRRGRPTNHVVYGVGQAILAGDALLSEAFEAMLRETVTLSPEQCKRHIAAMRIIAHAAGARGMVAGQSLDLYAEGRHCGEPELKYIHQHKTADMLTAAFEAGCALCAVDESICERLMRYARPVALMFQVVDDYLDVHGDPAVLGKSIGKDAASGKLTYVTQYGERRTREIIDELYAQAESALADVPGSEFLRELLTRLAHRES